MKIAVESSVFTRKQKTGVDFYSENLVRNTIQQMPDDTFWLAYVSFFTQPPTQLSLEESNAIPVRAPWLPGRVYYLLERLGLRIPYDFFCGIRPQIILYPNYIRWPLLWTKKSVVVVYDLSFSRNPQFTTKAFSRYFSKAVPKSVKKSSHVVVISENTKKEVMEDYGTEESKITVIYPAVDHSLFRPSALEEIQTVKSKYKIPRDYILCLGTIEPRKNLIGAIKAFSQIDSSLKDKYSLVLVGGKGWVDEETNALFDQLSQKYSIIKTGYAKQDDLPALYSGASVFLYPSFYEGFGMPPLEAMACGTPVITSNNTSLPEVVGNAGIMVEANDTTDIARAIESVLTDKKLAGTMSQKGLIQAKKFVWSQEASKLVNIFNNLNDRA